MQWQLAAYLRARRGSSSSKAPRKRLGPRRVILIGKYRRLHRRCRARHHRLRFRAQPDRDLGQVPRVDGIIFRVPRDSVEPTGEITKQFSGLVEIVLEVESSHPDRLARKAIDRGPPRQDEAHQAVCDTQVVGGNLLERHLVDDGGGVLDTPEQRLVVLVFQREEPVLFPLRSIEGLDNR